MTGSPIATAPLVVGIGGTTRARSSGELALRYSLRFAEQGGARTELLTSQDLQLPMYDPASAADPLAERFVDLVLRADALIIASPAYHAGISGLVKNALDHLEDLRLADPPYLDGKTVACIVTSRGPQGGALTLSALRSVVHALRGWPTPLGVVIDTSSESFGVDEEPVQVSTSNQLRTMTDQMLAAVEQRTGTARTRDRVRLSSIPTHQS